VPIAGPASQRRVEALGPHGGVRLANAPASGTLAEAGFVPAAECPENGAVAAVEKAVLLFTALIRWSRTPRIERLLNRWTILAGLVLAAIVVAVIGEATDHGVFDDVWPNLFWLAVSTILVSFVLQTLLGRSLASRRRSEDAFAFRTFCGVVLDELVTLSRLPANTPPLASAMKAGLGSAEEFAATARATADVLKTATGIHPAEYSAFYLEVASGLRSFAVNQIRLIAASRDEMVDTYGRLIRLAVRWSYREALTEGYQRDTASLPADAKETRQAATAEAEHQAVALVEETADLLADLAARATKPGIPAVPSV
jgi:hypothetical protein